MGGGGLGDMERREYLEAMRRQSIGAAGAVVRYKGGKYKAIRYEIWYESGEAKQGGLLMEDNGRGDCFVYAALSEIEGA